MTTETSVLSREIGVFEQKKVELQNHHNGKWVVIHDDAVVGVYDTIDAAGRFASAQFGRGPYLIRQIGASELRLPTSVCFRPAA